MMAILDSDTLRHPPLECVFTVSEEVGLVGAKAPDSSLLDARTMINLGLRGRGVATVSCAGGMRYALVRPQSGRNLTVSRCLLASAVFWAATPAATSTKSASTPSSSWAGCCGT